MKHVAVVGAGFSGAAIANSLAKCNYVVDLFECKPHLAGHCYTRRDPSTGINVHVYGPHIFNTSNERVWKYIHEFGDFVPFVNRVKAITQGRVFSLPINLLTINQFFGKTLSPSQAEAFIAGLGDQRISNPQTFEQQALKFLGRDLYEAFFEGYTIKQWGVHPSELPASILKRLPVRFDYDDNYYSSTYQGLPKNGYTFLVERMLDHANIKVHLNVEFKRENSHEFDHVFFSGPIDDWFGQCEGRLSYRTLDFAQERHKGDYQGNAVINYCDRDVPWTRISEHKHFSPWETHEETLVFKEFSRFCGPSDAPYYPIRLLNDKTLLSIYIDRARAERNTTFVGRLGTYRYLDMHIAISEALEVSELFLMSRKSGTEVPAFGIDPL